MDSSSSKDKEQKDASEFTLQSGEIDPIVEPKDLIALSDSVFALHSGYQEKVLQLINLDEQKSTKKPSISSIRSCCLSDDGKWFAVYSDKDSTLKIWLVENLLNNLRNFTGAKAQVFKIEQPEGSVAAFMHGRSLGMHFIGKDDSHLAISFATISGLHLSIINAQTGKKAGEVVLPSGHEHCAYGSHQFLSIQSRDDSNLRHRDLFVHNIQFDRNGDVSAVDEKGIALLSARYSNFAHVTASKDRNLIVVKRMVTQRDEVFIERYEAIKNPKAAAGFELAMTEHLPCRMLSKHYITRDKAVVYRDLRNQLCAFEREKYAKPYIITPRCEISCAMPSGCIMAVSKNGKYNIELMPGAIMRQALNNIVHKSTVTRLTGFTRPLGQMVGEFSEGPDFFSRPRKQILDYKESEKQIVVKELQTCLRHPLLSKTDRESIQTFLKNAGNFIEGANAALSHPGLTDYMREFWEDFSVVFGHSKSAAP